MKNKIDFDEVDFEKMDIKDFGKLACTFGDSKVFHDPNAKLYAFEANMKFSYKSIFTKFNVIIMNILNWFQWVINKCLKISIKGDIYEYFSKKNMEKSIKTEGYEKFFKFIDHIINIMDPTMCYEIPGNFIDLDDVEQKLYTRASDPDYVWHLEYDAMSNYDEFIKSEPIKLFKNVNLLQLDIMVWVDKKRSYIRVYTYTMADNDFEKLRNDLKNNETLNTLYSRGFRLH